jgi:hypothetical protein
VRGIDPNYIRQQRVHALDVPQDIIVPEPHDREALALKPGITRSVGRPAAVLTAVNFNHDILLE